jgi:large subunit ribosomal protein L7/L12
MSTKEEILDAISSMTVLELSELLTEFEERFGVTAAAPVAAVAAAPAAGGEKKINVIKVVRGLTSLGLAEAKAVVEGAPKAVLEGVSKDAAEDALKQIEEAGGSAEIS